MNLAAKILGTNNDLVYLLRDLQNHFPDADIDSALWDRALVEPARDILERSGKEIRAQLLDRCWHLSGGDRKGPPDLLPVMIELLHVGSLVLDDIEDDSPVRRGAPTLHRRYGVPLALNTGNWLLLLPLVLLSRLDLGPERRLALYEDVSRALLRCHEGQALDLSVSITGLSQRDVRSVVGTATRLKTGALMELAAVLGARSSGAPDVEVRAFGRFGNRVGVGLQMLDDWSGLSVTARRPKGVEDIRLGRPTWPWAWLADTLDEREFDGIASQARKVSDDAGALAVIDQIHGLLPFAADLIHQHLDSALADLQTALGETRPATDLRRDIERLERAYG